MAIEVPGRGIQANPTTEAFRSTQQDPFAGAADSFARTLTGLAQFTEAKRLEGEDDEIAVSVMRLKEQQAAKYDAMMNSPDATTPGLAERFGKQFAEEADNLANSFETERAQKIARNKALSVGHSMAMKAIGDENVIQVTERVRKKTEVIAATANMISKDPESYVEERDRTMHEIMNTGSFPPESRARMAQHMKSEYAQAALAGALEKNAIGVNDALKGWPEYVPDDSTPSEVAPLLKPVGEAGFESNLGELFQIEGGIYRDEATGEFSNLGISQKTYPDEDIANMTRERATFLYKRDFWDANNLSNEPPARAKLMFDMAVNHGAGNMRKIVADSDGTPDGIGEARERFYIALAKRKPVHQKDLKGWLARNKRVVASAKALTPSSGQIIAAAGEGSPQYKKMIAQLDPGVAAALEDLPFDARIRYIDQAESKANQERAVLRAELKDKVEDTVAIIGDGGKPQDLPDIATYAATYGNKAPERFAEDKLRIEQAKELFGYGKLTVAERTRAIQSSTPLAGDALAAEKGAHKDALELKHAQKIAATRKAPVAEAIKDGRVQPLRLDPTTGNPLFDLGKQLISRSAKLEQYSLDQGVPSADQRMTTKEEADMLGKLVFDPKMPPQDVIDNIKGFIGGGSKRNGWRILDEITKEAGSLRVATAIVASGSGSRADEAGRWWDNTAMPADVVSSHIINGHRIRTDKEGKSVRTPFKTADVKAQFGTLSNGAFASAVNPSLAADQEVEMYEAVNDAYTSMLSQTKGLVQGDDTLDEDLYRKAFEAVVGAPIEINGQSTLAPRGWRPKDARDVLNRGIARTFEEAGMQVPSNYRAEAVGNGKYVITNTVTPLRVNGKPVTIDLMQEVVRPDFEGLDKLISGRNVEPAFPGDVLGNADPSYSAPGIKTPGGRLQVRGTRARGPLDGLGGM